MKELLEWFSKHTYHFQLAWDKDRWKAEFRSRPLDEFYYESKSQDQGKWYSDQDADLEVLLTRLRKNRRADRDWTPK